MDNNQLKFAMQDEKSFIVGWFANLDHQIKIILVLSSDPGYGGICC